MDPPRQFKGVLLGHAMQQTIGLAMRPRQPKGSTMLPVPTAPRRRVLIVEDQADSRETLRLLLQAWGHNVEVAADGGAGVEKALSWHPEVAVVDIGLPVLDGYQLALRVRQTLEDRIFLIALTGYCQPEDRRRALESGFNVYLSKPADLDLLRRLLVGDTTEGSDRVR